MKQKFRIMILADDLSRLLSRILIIFNRRNLTIKNMNICQGVTPEVLRYTIDLECIDNQIDQLIKQIEKLIGVNYIFYYQAETGEFSQPINWENTPPL
ncbi:MAG: ACT domain-containing protein [Flavobacteriales bacterium]